MKRVFVFPGQGSQAVGMGRALAEEFGGARAVFAAVDDALGQKLSQLMWDGPESELMLTENAQPALMVVSMAVVRVLAENGVKLSENAAYVAGHSLGEYSALTATGALELKDAARLLKLRGQAMQRAVPVGVGAMAALLGLEFEAVVEVAEEAGQGEEICAAANDNAVGQVVVSGHAAAVARAIDLAKERGAKRAMELPVSAPFHCALMQPAADEMQAALAETNIAAPAVPVIANVRAAPVIEPEEIRQLLVEQITARVRWRESLLAMQAAGCGLYIELGTGKVLSGLVKRSLDAASVVNLDGPDDVDSVLAEL